MIAWLLLLITSVRAHSWVSCADYDPSASTSAFQSSACRGFSRGSPQFFTPLFGQDRGFNYQPGSNDPVCIVDFDRNSYSSAYPAPQYKPGSKIRVVWPAKNHVADRCTNQWIPDTTFQLWMNCDDFGTKRNPSLRTFLQTAQLVIDWKRDGNAKGFQNCPKFCDNPDKAVCHQDFTMPAGLDKKRCLFVWYWVFNQGTTPYTACWDINVDPVPTSTAAGGGNGAATCRNAVWGQCGGRAFNGDPCCPTGTRCVEVNEWYAQCRPPN